MSILQAAYTEVLAGFRNWKHLNEEARFANFQIAYSLIGKPFLQALTLLERSPEEITIYEGEIFISLTIKNRKYLLFRNGANPLTQLDCTCELSWRKKAKGDTSLLCVHEIIFQLSKYVFKNKVLEMDQVNELSELLYKNR